MKKKNLSADFYSENIYMLVTSISLCQNLSLSWGSVKYCKCIVKNCTATEKGSLFWLPSVTIGSIFHKKLGPTVITKNRDP